MEWTIYSFQLPLKTGGQRLGLVLQIDGEREHWGEIAPFPGRSKETLDQALDQLTSLLITSKVPEKLFPSVQFGLESALAFPPPKAKAELYAFLTGSPKEILQGADDAFKKGYRAVKFKINSSSKACSTDLLHALKDRFRLRIDCNSAFSFAEAMSLFSSFDPSVFDYIEDPTYEMPRLPEFSHPFALDETVLDYMLLPLEKYRNLYGFILKPTILGGKKGCAPLIEFVKKNRLNVVFSPAFESGLGLLQIFSLAHHFQLLEQPIGLDTHRSLALDILLPTVNFNTPDFSFDQDLKINTNLLQKVAHGNCELSYLRECQALA